MKKLVISFLILNCVLCIVPFCGAQVQSDCTAPPELTSYDRDIKHLAVGRMFQIHSRDTSLVRIPQKYIDTIAKGMGGIIHAMPEIPESDSVFNIYCVHADIEYDGITVGVDTSYSWTDAWQNLQAMTGNPLMDTMMVRYSLFVQQFYYWSSGCAAVINSDETWNLAALCDSVEIVPGVRYAEPRHFSGDGPDIGFNVIADDRYYDFAFKWGDCMAGCMYHYIWKFKVNSACQVSYLEKESNFFGGGWGAEYPVPVNCHIFSSVEGYAENAKLFVFPNPTDGIVDFRWPISDGRRVSLKVFDVQGHEVVTVFDGKWDSGQVVRWDADGLPAGVYYYQLRAKDLGQVGAGKVVKY